MREALARGWRAVTLNFRSCSGELNRRSQFYHSGHTDDLDEVVRWLVTRALVHRAVHFATEKPGVEFCALATYLGEMITHAHKLAHGENPKAQSHKDVVH
jgi:hypothetical protein